MQNSYDEKLGISVELHVCFVCTIRWSYGLQAVQPQLFNSLQQSYFCV